MIRSGTDLSGGWLSSHWCLQSRRNDTKCSFTFKILILPVLLYFLAWSAGNHLLWSWSTKRNSVSRDDSSDEMQRGNFTKLEFACSTLIPSFEHEILQLLTLHCNNKCLQTKAQWSCTQYDWCRQWKTFAAVAQCLINFCRYRLHSDFSISVSEASEFSCQFSKSSKLVVKIAQTL